MIQFLFIFTVLSSLLVLICVLLGLDVRKHLEIFVLFLVPVLCGIAVCLIAFCLARLLGGAMYSPFFALVGFILGFFIPAIRKKINKR